MELSLFKSNEFGFVRATNINGEPWFAAKDVATALGYANSRDALAKHVDGEDKGVAKCDTLGGAQDLVVINESGLYSLIFGSKLPRAKEFKHWVTSEVLPSIRKHGVYATETTIDDILMDPDFGIQLLNQLKEERKIAAELKKANEAMKPKALFADAVEASQTSILIGDLAKLIKQNGHDIGQNRLFEWLRERDYLIKTGSRRNLPTQKAMDLGLFEVKERTINNPDGSIRITRTTKVTGKGQIYFINKLVKKS
jgi:anti-repressor protein